jgi:membrane-bound lytic murein transglycosylase A
LQSTWSVLLQQCPNVSRKQAAWAELCSAAQAVTPITESAVRTFITTHFVAHEVIAEGGQTHGLMTGYYQPILRGSTTQTEVYRYPLYQRPKDLLTINLTALYPELKGQRVRGRVIGNEVIPYFSRAEIDQGQSPLQGQEILWVDDPYDAFFLHIQGSGLVALPDGRIVGVGYAEQNGHPYVAIGKTLIQNGELNAEEVSLASLQHWLKTHPDQAQDVLNSNPSYVFFHLRENADENPRGSLNVPLTANRSIAVDRRVIPLGSLVWMDTSLPDGSPLQRLMFAQDTGGAIKGSVRADVFFGTGDQAAVLAGTMKQPGRLFVLLPKNSEQNN